MRLKLLLSSVLTTLCMVCNAQSQSYTMVSNLGENLRLWEATGSQSYRENIDRLCTGKVKTTVGNELAQHLRSSLQPSVPRANSYELDSYLIWLEDAFQSGLKLTTTNYQSVSSDKIYLATDGERNLIKKNLLEFYKCDVVVSGPENFKAQDLICIYKDKQIAKISNYEEDARGRVHVDLSELVDETTLGATYNYSKDWPVGVSVNWSPISKVPFMLSLDFGINFDKDKVYKHDLTMTDVMNFTKNDYEYDSKWYATITPQFYLKYFSIGCGAGIMCISEKSRGLQATSTSSSSSSDNSSYFSSNSSRVTTSGSPEDKYKFMIRPTIKGFIPIVKDEWYITVSAAYNYCFAYKEVNGIDFGIGVQFVMDW